MLQKVKNKRRSKDSPIWKNLCIEDWENPNFTTYVNFKLIKLINRLSPIVNVILETFLRFKCTPIEIAQESFKETFSRLSYKNNARNTNFFTKNFTNCWYGEWLLVNEKVILMTSLDENQ